MNFTNSTKYSYIDGSNSISILLLLVISCILGLCFIIRCFYDCFIRFYYDNECDYCYNCCLYKSNKIINDEQI